MRGAEGGGNRIQIVQRIHVDPGGGDRDDQIGMPEAHRGKLGHLHVPVRQLVADQVGPGHAQMDAPRRQFARNLAGRQQDQFRALDAFDGAGIFTVRTGLAHGQAARAEPGKGLVHQPPLGRHPDLQRHDAALSAATRPGRITPPTAGIDRPCPRTAVSAS